MGMFDYLYCDYPLPDAPPVDQISKWQTKSFDDPRLSEYRITSDGRLQLEFPDDTFWTIPYHGDIVFYGSYRARYARKAHWWEYRARFTNGKLESIVKVE